MHATEHISAGIDWLTLTLASDVSYAGQWVENCLPVLDEIAKEGYELKYRTLQGYYGISAGNNFVGTREDGHMVQLTGSHANDYFNRVYRQSCHVSRIDVQCTVKYKEMPNDIARTAYADCEASNLLLPAVRRRKLLLLTGSDGGDTVYIGSPSSNQRCRIYNKERQSEDIRYTRCWRYEVVYKNDLATAIAKSLPSDIAERATYAISAVCGWLKARGTNVDGIGEHDAVVLPLSRTLPTDVEKRMKWLKTQVVPTMKALIEAGLIDELRELLDGTGIFRNGEGS